MARHTLSSMGYPTLITHTFSKCSLSNLGYKRHNNELLLEKTLKISFVYFQSGADVIIGWVTADGQVTVRDM